MIPPIYPMSDFNGRVNQLNFITNCNPKDFKFLKNGFLYSFYEEKYIDKISLMFESLGLDKTKEFRSCSVLLDGKINSTVKNFGSAICVLDYKIANQMYVFNGDIQNLADKYGEALDKETITNIVTLKGNDLDLYNKLKIIFENDNREPRLVGSYFEARLKRGLCLSDIKEIYCDNHQGIEYYLGLNDEYLPLFDDE